MSLPGFRVLMVATIAVLAVTSTRVEGASGNPNRRNISNASSLQLKAGESFIAARAKVVRHGWTPFRMHNNDMYEYDGAEKRLAERGFLEVDSCSIDAGANCTLYYRKDAGCLRLDTVGEQVDDMRITRWAKECPSTNR